MIPSLNGTNTTQQTGATSAPVSTSPPLDALASESTFLKLMVAQLQNQDPESPQDGTQFVAQLAQFSSLEQQLDMHSDLDSIKADLTPAAAASTSSSGTTGTGTTTGSSTNASQGS